MSPRSRELSERMKAKSRRAIMSAALNLFAKNGFSATTTDEIAKKARVSKGLIFSHFPTKEDILLAMIDNIVDQLMPPSEDQLNALNPRQKLISIIDTWFGLLEKEPSMIRLALRLNLDDGWRKILRKKGKQYIELYLGRMRKLLVQAGSTNPDLDSYLLSTFFDGVSANYVAAPDLLPLKSIKDRFVEMLMTNWDHHK